MHVISTLITNTLHSRLAPTETIRDSDERSVRDRSCDFVDRFCDDAVSSLWSWRSGTPTGNAGLVGFLEPALSALKVGSDKLFIRLRQVHDAFDDADD
jgi:hypothetical protein